ncbi:MAG: alpha/beta hydrolase [Oscillospiraceae bacterium]|nr:alpha/beta hydrolase [Oscillospiraceae bacterium]
MVTKIERWFGPAKENRTIHLYLPDDYDRSDERYPVVYMFDGHNLYYDSEATFGKSLGMKEFLDGWGKKFIVVGIACAADELQRVHEYCPFDIRSFMYGDIKGRGEATAEWIVKELKPWVDQNYRTWPFREATAIGGYSMGGMMCLYTVLRYNAWFSKAAVISPALAPSMQAFEKEIAASTLDPDTRIFFSWGTAEGSPESVQQQEQRILKLERLVQAKGAGTYLMCQEGGDHNEASWEHQLPVWMTYLWN